MEKEVFDFAAMKVVAITVVENCFTCDCGDGCDGGTNDDCDCVSCDSCDCDD